MAAAPPSMGEAGDGGHSANKGTNMEMTLSMDELSQVNGGAQPSYEGVKWGELKDAAIDFADGSYGSGAEHLWNFFASYPNPTPGPGDVTDPMSGLVVGRSAEYDNQHRLT
jgi:hypothetical protein